MFSLNLKPFDYLCDILAIIADYSVNRVADLLLLNFKAGISNLGWLIFYRQKW